MATKLAGGGNSRLERSQHRAPERRRHRGSSLGSDRLRDASLGAIRAVHRLARRTPVGPLLGALPVGRIRERLFQIHAHDVLRVIDALETTGVRFWVGGGWGVDALLGRVTRRHRDLDVVLTAGSIGQRQADIKRVTAALGQHGFRFHQHVVDLTLWFPERVSVRDRAGHCVDLLPIDAVPDEAFAMGSINGRRVPCLAPATQLRLHSGYDLRAEDRNDIEALCDRFGLRPVAEEQMNPAWH